MAINFSRKILNIKDFITILKKWQKTAFFNKLARKFNMGIFKKSTMMGQFFENLHKHAGQNTPTATIETSILCLFQRLQLV